MNCFIDLDGILVDFVGGASKLLGVNPYDSPNNYGIEWMDDAVGLTSEEFWQTLYKNAGSAYKFWAGLEKTQECDVILQTCIETFGIEHICILTAPTLTPECASGKVKWILDNIPELATQFLIGKPKYFCANRNSILIDDLEKNCYNFSCNAGKSILFPTLANNLYHEYIGLHNNIGWSKDYLLDKFMQLKIK